MKPAKWLFVAGIAILFGSCGENSTTSDETNTDSVTTNTTTGTSSSYASVDVPSNTRTTFETKYPSATNVQWSRYNTTTAAPVEWDMAGWPMLDTSDYVVTFDWDGYDYYAWYDEGGNWIGSTYTMTDHSKLPSSVNSAIQSQFAGYSIVEVDREMDKNRSAYEVELQKGDEKIKVLFDDNGKVIKKKTRGADGTKTKEKEDSK
jgi:hypothetical protein